MLTQAQKDHLNSLPPGQRAQQLKQIQKDDLAFENELFNNSHHTFNLNTSSLLHDDPDIIEVTSSITQKFPHHKMQASNTSHSHGVVDLTKTRPATRRMSQLELLNQNSALTGFSANSNPQPTQYASPSKRFIPRITTTPSKALEMTSQMLGGGKPTLFVPNKNPSFTATNLTSRFGPAQTAKPVLNRPSTRRSVRDLGPTL